MHTAQLMQAPKYGLVRHRWHSAVAPTNAKAGLRVATEIGSYRFVRNQFVRVCAYTYEAACIRRAAGRVHAVPVFGTSVPVAHMYIWIYSFWSPSRAQPCSARETELVPAIKDTGFPTPVPVRIGATSSVKGHATTSGPSVARACMQRSYGRWLRVFDAYGTVA